MVTGGKRTFVLLLAIVSAWIPLTILALLWGSVFDWPDFVHVNYGFPVVWATNTLSTIAGPVDIWDVYMGALFVDLVFWQGSMVAALAVVSYVLSKKT